MLVYFVIVSVFVLLYFSIINKLKPLKILRKKVQDFGNEKFDFDYSSSNEDEISQLAKEFDSSAKKLKN